MMNIQNYLSERNIFIGGHYQWPSMPDKHALLSTELILSMHKRDQNSKAYIFIDDIGATMMCLSKCGVRKAVEPIESKEDEAIYQWIDDNIDSLEDEIVKNNDFYIVKKFRELLFLLNMTIKLEKFTPKELVYNFEKVIYAYARSKSRALVLSYILEKKVPKLIWEKSINNRTSKELHKLKKRKNQNLVICEKKNSLRYLISDYITAEEILLREEIVEDAKVLKASNRCSGLLSTFFNKLVIDNLTNEETLTLFYVIPEEDRYRLEQGIKSFMTLYIEIYKKDTNLKKITIVTVILQESYLLDIYQYDLMLDVYTHSKLRVNEV